MMSWGILQISCALKQVASLKLVMLDVTYSLLVFPNIQLLMIRVKKTDGDAWENHGFHASDDVAAVDIPWQVLHMGDGIF